MKLITVKYTLLLLVLCVLMASKASAYDGTSPSYGNWWNYQPQTAQAPAQGAGAEPARMIPVVSNSQQLTGDEWRMVELVNQERTARGLQPLQIDLRVVETARVKAQDLIVNNYFDHQSPTLGSPFDQMKRAGIRYKLAGENLAGSPNVERAHASLMKSPSHRANILNPRYTHIGIGALKGGAYGMMFVQHFLQQ